jgi:hypothetical protein
VAAVSARALIMLAAEALFLVHWRWFHNCVARSKQSRL